MLDVEPTVEDWAWERIRAGETADFNIKLGNKLDPREPSDGWNDDRKLGAGFLRRVFFERPDGGEIPVEGARIVGAYLPEGQVLHSGRVSRDVWLHQCRSEKTIDFFGAAFDGWLSLEDCWVGQTTDSDSVTLVGGNIGRGLNLSGVTLQGALNGIGLHVGQVLHMGRDRNIYSPVGNLDDKLVDKTAEARFKVA